MTKLDKKIISDLEGLVRDAGLDPLPVEWVSVSNENLADNLQGAIPIDIEYWEDGYMYFAQQDSARDWTTHKVYGVLEVIYHYGDHAVGFIREDMPLGTQMNVVLHAYAHADFMKNHSLKVNYKNVISSYVSNVWQYRKKLKDFEGRYGLDFVESVEDLAESLADITSRFNTNEIFPKHTNIEMREHFDREKEVFIIEDPDYPSQDEHDLLHSLMTVPWVSDPIKEIMGIFRHRKMYLYPLIKTKIVDEGWCSYWDSELYRKAGQFLGIKDFLLDNPYPKIQPLRSYKSSTIRYINFSDLIEWLFTVLNNPYYIGYIFWKSKSTNKDLNLFKYAHSITNNELFEQLTLQDLVYGLNMVLPFNIDYSLVKDHPVFIDLVKFIRKYGLSRTYSGYIPVAGIRKKELKLNLIDRPYYEWRFDPSRDPVEIGQNCFLILDIPVNITSNQEYHVNEFSNMLEILLKRVMNIEDVEIDLEVDNSFNADEYNL